MAGKVAVIAGASGIIGRRLAQTLLDAGSWTVTGLARRPPAGGGMRWIAVDLGDADDCRRKLSVLQGVTHVFYTARYDHPEGTPESVEINAAMLANLVDAFDTGGTLEHVHAVHGSKYYGHQLGPIPVPVRESSPRAPNENFYFVQEDFLRSRSAGQRWSYSTTRPHTFCDRAPTISRSIGLIIGIYAAIQRELGHPLDFPGTGRAFHVRTQFTDIPLLARAIAWMVTDPGCANESFNVVNGDNPSWAELWPGFARQFALEPGRPLGIDLNAYISDKADVWQRVVARNKLQPSEAARLALWSYGNYVFKPEWDIMSSMEKARARGFAETVDSAAMFTAHFAAYRAHRLIPQFAR